MSQLLLKDIGKIYVSENNVTVGIRGVNLAFDRGEFVAVTGKSGSGKSTLLNVISGMDSYEEGELFICGEPTSHYMQSDWEEYRERYISFIFQDYNIIESFTVLENVELALMRIEDKKQRRARALELIERVGMTSHIHHKGSKLSGGQKQRTVIARALAKDSPIILADEPTGNLDSKTSEEIIELLREVSRDKLLIVVTHNFEEVEKYATRHIRIFDGTVESDTVISVTELKEATDTDKSESTKPDDAKKKIRDGITLGKALFTSKPKLTVFLCMLMLVGAIGVFLVTSISHSALDAFEAPNMFTHIDGRVVITTRSGEVLTEDEVKKLKEDYGAEDYLRYDMLLDRGYYNSIMVPVSDDGFSYEFVQVNYTYGEDFGDKIIGRYPEKIDEVFLYLPISYKTLFGKNGIERDKVIINDLSFTVTGIKYYHDNNMPAKCMLTEEGFLTLTVVDYMISMASTSVSLLVTDTYGDDEIRIPIYYISPSFDVEDGKAFVSSKYFDKIKSDAALIGKDLDFELSLNSVYYSYNYYYSDSGNQLVFSKDLGSDSITDVRPDWYNFNRYGNDTEVVIISDEVLREIALEVLDRSYRQVSLFFEDDNAAHEAAKKLQSAGYVAVVSDTTYSPEADTVILNMLSGIMLIGLWLLSIVFLAAFLNLCSSRALEAFRDDISIMRSMGIKVSTIKIGMYLRMLLCVIPGCVTVIALAILIFTSPMFNGFFSYLYAWQYAIMFFGLVLLTAFTTRRQIGNLFRVSVKKSLKGGERK